MKATERVIKRKATPFDPSAEVIKPRHLRLVVGLSAVSVWRLRRQGKFPQPLQLSTGRIGWRRADLERWLAERERAPR